MIGFTTPSIRAGRVEPSPWKIIGLEFQALISSDHETHQAIRFPAGAGSQASYTGVSNPNGGRVGPLFYHPLWLSSRILAGVRF